MVLTPENLQEIEEYITQILPELLIRDPKIAVTIEGILAQHFPRRDEFSQLLAEVRASREENAQRFEQVDQRFEQVDQRFGQVDQRFEEVDKKLLLIRRDIAKLQSGQENIIKRMDGQENWIRLMVGGIHNDEGSMAEDLVAAALRYGLRTDDINPESIELRRSLVDRDGAVFLPGYRTEVDIIARNGHLTIFEVKAHRVKPGDVGMFALKLKLFAAQNPDVAVRGLLIVPGAQPHVQEECEQYGIELIH